MVSKLKEEFVLDSSDNFRDQNMADPESPAANQGFERDHALLREVECDWQELLAVKEEGRGRFGRKTLKNMRSVWKTRVHFAQTLLINSQDT